MAWLIRVPSSTATVNVADAGLGSSGSVTAMIAVFAAAAASVKTLVTAASLLCGVPIPAGSGVRSTSRAARAPAREATSESTRLETPSRTTRTAREPGFSLASSAMASSLRLFFAPLSHTPATQVAGVSRKWSRSLGALVPQDRQ